MGAQGSNGNRVSCPRRPMALRRGGKCPSGLRSCLDSPAPNVRLDYWHHGPTSVNAAGAYLMQQQRVRETKT